MPTNNQPEIERLVECLRGLVDEHRRLLDLATRHQVAMKKMDTTAIDVIGQQQEQSRTRIMQWEARRKLTVTALARAAKMTGVITLSRLAGGFPAHRAALMTHCDQLRILATEIQRKTTVSSRIAQAMLGHLNTAVRLLAAAMERGGTYTKQGTPKLTRRMGTMEAIG